MSWSTAPAVATPRMMTRTLATFYVFAAVAGLLAALNTGFTVQVRWSMVALSASVLACAGIAVRWGPRWPRNAFHVAVASASVLIVVAILVSPDPATAMAAATLMSFIAVDACFFFSLPLAWAHMVLALGGMTVALLVRGEVPAFVTLTLVPIIIALGSVTRGLVIRASSASRDPLTGLANRRGFDDSLQELLAATSRSGDRLSAVLLDLDFFKQVNDARGHEAGDLVLCRVADVWQRELPEGAFFARQGGDEFALLLPGVRGVDALALVRRIVPLHPEISMSCGVAQHERGETAAQLMRRADRALYDAKAAGRGRCELDGDGGSPLAGDLALALAAGEVQVHLQPIADTTDGAVVGVEALARWTHPERGPVPPTEFVAAAEQSGLIAVLDAHVVRTACASLAGVRTTRGEQLTLGVNVSGLELSDPGYPARLQALLAETGFPAEHLVLEVTETLIEADSSIAVAALHTLRAAGLKVAIDDFGTGFSSLSRLDTLPADVIKLDRSLVASIDSSPRRQQMVGSLAAMCRGLGLDVTAEGVETAGQAAALARIGCAFSQGWFHGRPVPIAELLASPAVSQRAEVDCRG
ncbi:EAL domain-containing protein [Modestobacter sp. L9-4]|uniref:putative bifunctional diguanylate cyclase/phosphodiesterase n=1 Tax=Modestobacter sp. L9-4 TaxID=2851567 RepID=UPI001C76C60C|nr:GGDEF domain-containing phosphodiesterase [Modestobacter sp. L9-4]QXG76711.1 EAL domain-containing protein [Modestobacter sp. L9-4]